MSELWDQYGTPLQPHSACPKCEDASEVGSHHDDAWCCACGWRGSLTEITPEEVKAFLLAWKTCAKPE